MHDPLKLIFFSELQGLISRRDLYQGVYSACSYNFFQIYCTFQNPELINKYKSLRQKNKLGLLLVILLTCITLYIRFGPILTATPKQVIQGYGDAFNAYNLVTYHAKYDPTYTVFEGMAYPYGEHVTIASTIPLVSNGLKFLKSVGLDLTDYSIPILHYSMLFSYLVCAIFLYLIFSRLALPPWYSLVLAIALTFMSPQTERLFGHYGLAHLYAIPATIYFLMRFDEQPNWWSSIGLFLTVLLTSLIQFYFFAITAFMIGIFYFFSFIKKARPSGNESKKWIFPRSDFLKYSLHFSFQVLFPYLLFLWWFAQYDVPNRPDKPYGFLLFISHWEGLFLSLRMPYYEWINDNWIEIRKVNFEGLAYVGIVAFGVFLSMLVHWVSHLFKRSFFQKMTVITSKKAGQVSENELILMKGLEKLVYDDADFLRRLFAMAFVLLIFSFGLPFVLPNLSFLLDYSGPLKQFRSVGRFNWIFYFVINIIIFTYLYRKFRHQKIWLLLPLSLLVYESWQFNHARKYSMATVEEFHTGKTFKDKLGINFDDYQAILPIPYFNVGTDNFDAKVHGRIQQKSLALSMETGLPSLASMGNRSSVSRAYKLFQTTVEPYQRPSILDDFKNEKPLLLMIDTSHIHRFPYLEEGTKFIKAVDAMRYYELPIAGFQKRIELRKQAIQQTLTNDSTLVTIDGFLKKDSSTNFIYKSFDDQTANFNYKGTGSLHLDISTPQTIFKAPLTNFKKGDKGILSFWGHDLRRFPVANTFVHAKIRHPQTNEIVWQFSPQIRYLLSVMDNNGWCLIEMPLDIKENGLLEITIKNEAMTNQPFIIDELMIRTEGTDLYKSTNKNFINNRYY